MAKQRGNNEGSIYQRKDGRWTAAVSGGRDKSGRSKREYLYGKTRKEVAEELAKRRMKNE
jgi:integrase